MRTCHIMALAIVLNFSSPARADGNLGDNDAAAYEDTDSIRQQEKRIAELRRILEMSEPQVSAVHGSAATFNPPIASGKSERPQAHSIRAKDYFDLTDISVICFTRDGRPVCGRDSAR